MLNTNICTAMSLLTWTILDVLYYKKPSIIGAVQGMITGLVAITPAAGVIAGWGAIVMGVLSGSIPWASMNLLEPNCCKYLQKGFLPRWKCVFDNIFSPLQGPCNTLTTHLASSTPI